MTMKTMTMNPAEGRPRPGRYARLLLDNSFKRAFGSEEHKRLLELFLAEVIPERTITDLTFTPQEHPSPFPDGKGIRIDVECTDADGSRFIVEMQLAKQSNFYERALFYSSFGIQEQMIAGQGRYDFPPVYFIALLDFSLHENSDRVLFRYDLRERQTQELMTDRIQYIFLELPNCRRPLTPEATALENFCYVLRNIENLPERPEGLQTELFRLLFETAEIANFAPQDRIKYESEMRTEQDLRNQIEYAREEGLEKGLEKGREEGRKEELKETLSLMAEQMRAHGVSEEAIAEMISAVAGQRELAK